MTNLKRLEVCRNVLFSDLQEIVLNSFRFEIDRLTLFKMKKGGKKPPFPTNFPPVSSPNLGINPQYIRTFFLVLILLPHCCQISLAYLVPLIN